MPQMEQVADKLLRQTQRGKVDWQRDLSPSFFRARFGDLSVVLSQDSPRTGPVTYLSVVDGRGKTIQAVTSDEADFSLQLTLDELYAAAKGFVLSRNDKILDELLAILDAEG